MNRFITYMVSGLALGLASCSDFLDTAPYDALSPATTWKTENDAEKFMIGCYDGWADETGILYWDCASDFGFNFHPHEGWREIGAGTMTPTGTVANYYNFSLIRRCNDFLKNIESVQFADQSKKNDMIGQVKTIRAYQYFTMNWLYGGVPIIDSYETAAEAQVPRNTTEEVRDYIYKDLDEAVAVLSATPKGSGYIGKGTALAIKMRTALYHSDFQVAKAAAKAIIDLGQYDLHPDFAELFTLDGKGSKEIIASAQHLDNIYDTWMIATMYNNGDGGWSSMVPTQNFVDAFEMSNGMTTDEPGSGYDPTHPFANRDPRMAMSVLYPGMDWNGSVLNTLDATINGKANPNNNGANNCSKTRLTWAKYLAPMDQYADVWSTSAQPIIFRYAEVLLSYAEAENELNGPSAEVYGMINKVRERAGMPDVDQAKYSTKDKLRELIRRERGSELGGEGLRRIDIIRWKDASGKMVAETVLNKPLMAITGTIDYNEPDPTKRAVVTGSELVENRQFKPYLRYLPIPLSAIEKNPKLEQNEGY